MMSFTIKDDEGYMFLKHDQPYAERLAEWQALEDAKSLEDRLDECRLRAIWAMDDSMKGCRNAPEATLETELNRGYALQGLINSKSTVLVAHYATMLSKIPPVEGPAMTFHDHAELAARQMAEHVDRIIMGRLHNELA